MSAKRKVIYNKRFKESIEEVDDQITIFTMRKAVLYCFVIMEMFFVSVKSA